MLQNMKRRGSCEFDEARDRVQKERFPSEDGRDNIIHPQSNLRQ
jgi:hypothetical protein